MADDIYSLEGIEDIEDIEDNLASALTSYGGLNPPSLSRAKVDLSKDFEFSGKLKAFHEPALLHPVDHRCRGRVPALRTALLTLHRTMVDRGDTEPDLA